MLSRRRQSGFNLVEIAVAVSVLGILIAAGLPSMADWMRSIRVRNLAETTQNGLQRARNEAMKRNRVVTFWLVSPATTASPDASCKASSKSGAWVISLDDPTDKCNTAASPTVAPRIVETYGPGAAGGDVVVKATDRDGDDASSISFNAFGQPVSGSSPIANIDFEHADASVRKLRIQISSSGGVRMCDQAVAAPDSRACN